MTTCNASATMDTTRYMDWRGSRWCSRTGIIGDVHMETGRRHDSYLLSQSNLNNRLALVQQGNSVQCKVYGDAGYPIMSHIDRRFRGANLTPAQRAYNKKMPAVRIRPAVNRCR